MADFYIAVKSTIDKLAVDIANSLSIGFVEVDDTVNIDDALASKADLIVYQMVGMDEDPTDPLWSLGFSIGGKTVSDASNQGLAAIISGIRLFISKGDSVDIMNYSGVSDPVQKEGYIYFADVSVDPQAFDGAAGIRMINVQGRAVRTSL